MSSITQVEIGIRELRLYARKEAANELPGSRNTDLYALFRSLSIPNIVTLLEYTLSEARIILYSSHTAMLHLASAALTSLLYPLKWAGVFIPVLPYRLIQALEAPCPYIVGVERRYDPIEWPEDDFVLVDLDQNTIEVTTQPTQLPRQQRRKLTTLLQAAAPHHNKFGVAVGPPAYAIETFPHDSFSSENTSVFSAKATPSTLPSYVSKNSASYGDAPNANASSSLPPPAVFNAFLSPRHISSRGSERPSTSSTSQSSTRSPPSPNTDSPISSTFPTTPVSRNDSGYHLQASLREKRSGHFDGLARRNSSVPAYMLSQPRLPPSRVANFRAQFGFRRPSQPSIAPHQGHNSNPSTSTLNSINGGSTYAPSVYAQSTLAASTVMPNMLMQPVRDTETTKWQEGHCMAWRPRAERTICTICDEKADDGIYCCSGQSITVCSAPSSWRATLLTITFDTVGCALCAHPRCVSSVVLPCPPAFRADAVHAAFVRCFASLFYTYRRFLQPASGDRRKAGLLYHFNMEGFMKGIPHENAEYLSMLRQTQAFNEFIHERESTRPDDPSIKLFDEVILSKKNRGRTSLFSKSSTNFLSDTSDHLWRSAAATPPNSRFPGDYRQVVSRSESQHPPTQDAQKRAGEGNDGRLTLSPQPNSPGETGPLAHEGAAHDPGRAAHTPGQDEEEAHP
ncbi:hypothetical protein LTR66_014588 [Elasticomyces elasticus]|nr:hypothetical protein LTR66_014588 [Elasticomyces elasticus]